MAKKKKEKKSILRIVKQPWVALGVTQHATLQQAE